MLNIRRFGLWYNSMINMYPRTTKTITAVAIATVADISAQYIHHRTLINHVEIPNDQTTNRSGDRTKEKEDYRTNTIERKFPPTSSPSSPSSSSVPKKSSSFGVQTTKEQKWTDISLDPPFFINWYRTGKLVLFTTLITPAIHHWYLYLLARHPTRPFLRMLFDQLFWAPIGTTLFIVTVNSEPSTSPATHQKILQGIRANWMLWPIIQYLNFTYIPPAYNILFANFVSYFWTVYLSRLANDPLLDHGNSTGGKKIYTKSF